MADLFTHDNKSESEGGVIAYPDLPFSSEDVIDVTMKRRLLPNVHGCLGITALISP
jgi:hypothetical protein